MATDKNIPGVNSSQNNFPTYNRAGRLRSGSYNGTPFSRVLASFRSASEIPVPAPLTNGPEEPQKLLNPVSAAHSIPQDKNQSNIDTQNSPVKLDELTREKLENRVRQKKRLREKCPFTGINGECCRPDIRCGERAQFSGRESNKQQSMPHRCLYTPYFSSDNVIIVEKDPFQREFMLNSFKLFLNYDMEKIATLETAEAATEILTRYKLQNRMVGLVIVNGSTLGTGTHQFLTELYERNCNTEIILTGELPKDQFTTLREFSEKEIAPGFPFISTYLQTPIHTEKLVETINSLHFGRFL